MLRTGAWALKIFGRGTDPIGEAFLQKVMIESYGLTQVGRGEVDESLA